MTRVRPLLAALVVLGAAPGCLGHGPGRDAGPPTVAEGATALEGWILDAAVLPVAGANVTVPGANASTATDGAGHYAFQELPDAEALVVVAEADGYVTLSKSVTLAPGETAVLNFTLDAVPRRVPHVEVRTLKGLVACQVAVAAADETRRAECGGNDPANQPSLDFAVGPDTAGVVLELEWEAGTPAARTLNLTVETVGFGDQDQVLAAVDGASVLRARVNALQAARYYAASGGLVRAAVSAGTNPDEDESTVGASAPVQQAFDLHVSVFYVDPPLPNYSAVG